MEILTKALDALWQVLAVGVLLGAGLPALFALGLRSLHRGRIVHTVASGTGSGGYSPGGDTAELTSRPSAAGLAGAIICFSIVIGAVAFGIIVVIFGNQIFG